ncbi:hypothetical protein PSTG_11931 [Puccinia striiformis f. sp. tritici PST-78]|uniref:Uncharacterized protein n=1 Tax=Puccinia striiformis f. sp. tritici PST-78 TaxID=1165861 RepID=A0A0L0V639_9BASI|nr:hypothetical protein PSTG_11931 [Puccinia striiformis f. sp. tritici PST-78]
MEFTWSLIAGVINRRSNKARRSALLWINEREAKPTRNRSLASGASPHTTCTPVTNSRIRHPRDSTGPRGGFVTPRLPESPRAAECVTPTDLNRCARLSLSHLAGCGSSDLIHHTRRWPVGGYCLVIEHTR